MNLFRHDHLRWKHYTGDAQFDHPISYWGAVLDAREDGHVDLLYRWDPDSACHLHRHTAAVSSLVLEGELTVIDIDLETGKEALLGSVRELVELHQVSLMVRHIARNSRHQSGAIRAINFEDQSFPRHQCV